MERTAQLGYDVLNPEELNYDKDNALSNTGCDPNELVDLLKDEGPEPYTYYPGGSDGIYYFTYVGDGAAVWYSKNGWDYWSDFLEARSD